MGVMQFDLLAAMMRMKKEFGIESYILAGNTDRGFFLQLRAYHLEQQYAYRFEITHIDIAHKNTLLFEDHFEMAIAKLKAKLLHNNGRENDVTAE